MNDKTKTSDCDTLLIAVDGGATKTDLILFCPEGRIINRVIGGPSNSSEIGFARSTETLRDLFRQLLAGHGGFAAPIVAIHAGLAGGGIETNKPRYRHFLEQLFPQACVGNGSDAVCAINSGLESGDGMVLIAGTGSSLFVRTGDQIRQIGGWGHLLSDEGSGYDIGRMGLKRALQSLDGRMPPTLLTGLFEEKLGQPVDRAIPKIYEGGKRLISSLSRQVFAAVAAGDKAAAEILQESACELAQLLTAGSRFLPSPPFRVVLAGGLWEANDGLLQKLVGEQLKDQYIFIIPELSPVYGSAVAAMRLGGLPLTDDFRQAFRESLSAHDYVKNNDL